MKKRIAHFLFFVTLTISAQTYQDLNLDGAQSTVGMDSFEDNFTEETFSLTESFEEAAKRNNIPHRKFEGLAEVENGYYIISGVFSKGKNLKKTIKKSQRKGFKDAGYIVNPQNGLNYVYLSYYPFGLEAVDACASKLDGQYTDDLWILEVENSVAIGGETFDLQQEIENAENESAQLLSIDNFEETKNSSSVENHNQESNEPQITKRGQPNKSLIIQRADSYFDKLWYAEAAKLYEEALQKEGDNYSYEVIQKAADCYYYNTNMEKAYEWYHKLYEHYGDEMSADMLFKYSHALKGTGKYKRAKRLMRLYNRKTDDAQLSRKKEVVDSETARDEIVLDRLLKTASEYEIKNLAVNTKYSDFSPMFLDSSRIVFSSAADSSFFTTRTYKWNNQPYLDLYVAKLNQESQDLREAIKFSKKINTKYHEASVTFSPDNTTMYFTRNNYGKKLKRDKKGINHLKIYKSTKVDDEWTEAVEVSFNSDSYSTGHPALSPDGKKLYFVSDMPGSIGKTDIFVVDVLENGSFSEPRNLGPNINTEHKEMFPFINGQKLYFSSDGHTGLGGLDIYQSHYDAEKGFGQAQNMGKPINSNKDDFSYIVNDENQQGYFASNRKGGKGDDDIYSFKRLLVEEVPANLNAIAGVVTQEITGDNMPKALVQLLDENGIKLKEILTQEDGSFIFEDLESNKKYTVKTVQSKFFENEQIVTTKDNQRVNIDVSMKRLEEMIAVEEGIKKLKTEMIYFNFDKWNIRSDASKELNKLVSVMKEYPGMVIKIESHTDSRGSRVYNEYLSDKRAKSTRDYIISQGIDPSRIESAIGYGESRLINECDGTVRCTEEAHFLNRRSEFIIVKM
ncbi:OmpA family protein [Pareuzebyella sediminis]|uniref:OmpA family protein n=1 Tax=Pareuzebyella sediminis TaxID=2607998 RepID=UPI001E302DF4|nr:OmpA family protein [Pareuzebyella sediminis]